MQSKKCMTQWMTYLAAIFFVSAVSAAPPSWTLSAGVADELDGDRSQLIEASWLAMRSPIKLADYIEVVGGRINGRRAPLLQRSVGFLGLGVRKYWTPYLFSGFALVGVSAQTEAISSDYQFVSSLGLQWRRITITGRHLSNASTNGRNRGETYLAIGVNW